MAKSRKAMFLLFLLFFFRMEILKATSCGFDSQVNWEWQSCHCETIQDQFKMTCRRRDWMTVPTLPQIDMLKGYHKSISLSITDGILAFLGQDTFKGYEIQSLDLSNNNIETINVNAFRGQESQLNQLILSRNNLKAIPARAMTYLHHLQHLHLQRNRINEINSATFEETQLKNLRYLYLDQNQISILPTRSLSRLSLQVLTLSNNCLLDIEKQALPSTIWFLDLKNNRFKNVPYHALDDNKRLRTLDLEGNEIMTINSDAELRFEEEFELRLSNNRISQLEDMAFNRFRKFQVLDLSYNKISKIGPKAFEAISSIKHLDLSYNFLVHIPDESFNQLAKTLIKLNLEDNDLHRIPTAMQTLRVLEQLNINNNKLLRIEDDALKNTRSTLKELQLAKNRLTQIPSQAFKGMNKLQYLDLSKNRITTIENMAFGGFKDAASSLVRLDLAGNMIETVSNPGAFLYMNALAYLDLSHNRIKRITSNALARLNGLESLSLQNNELENIPDKILNESQKLRYLLLDSNHIGTLFFKPTEHIYQLERLSLSHNKISFIDGTTFQQFKNLRSINLGYNRLTKIIRDDFNHLQKLEHLILENNRLTTIEKMAFVNMTNLHFLNLAENQIENLSEMSFASLPNLERLTIAHNRLSMINKKAFSNVDKLEYLDISHNKISVFNFLSNLPLLHELDLSYNDIDSFDFTWTQRTLRKLNLAQNSLQWLKKDSFQNYAVLSHLDLSYNKLIEISSQAFIATPQLTFLRLSHNHLTKCSKGIFANQEMFEWLDLSWNALAVIDSGIFGVDNVHELTLANNDLSEVPIGALTSIRNSLSYLDLSGNKIRTLDAACFAGLHNISKFILSHNRIDTIEEKVFEQMRNLRWLDLSHNPITSWNPRAFQGLSNFIERLFLSDTGLFSMPKISSTSISHLNISHNKIYELQEIDLKMFGKVISLDLSHNNLVALDAAVFKHLMSLKHLNLSHNPIYELGEDHLQSFSKLETLRMHDMASLGRLAHVENFARLRNLREFSFMDIPNVAYYNSSALLAHLPALRKLELELKEEEIGDQLAFADLRRLRHLTITGTTIKRIHTKAFSDLRGYQLRLEIVRTGITSFDSALFDTMGRVNFLSLSLNNNRLATVNPFLHSKIPNVNQHGTILEEIHLNANPIVCDCSMAWLYDWFHYKSQQNHDIAPSSTRCTDKVVDSPTLREYYYGKHSSGIRKTCAVNAGHLPKRRSHYFMWLILLNCLSFTKYFA